MNFHAPIFLKYMCTTLSFDAKGSPEMLYYHITVTLSNIYLDSNKSGIVRILCKYAPQYLVINLHANCYNWLRDQWRQIFYKIYFRIYLKTNFLSIDWKTDFLSIRKHLCYLYLSGTFYFRHKWRIIIEYLTTMLRWIKRFSWDSKLISNMINS